MSVTIVVSILVFFILLVAFLIPCIIYLVQFCTEAQEKQELNNIKEEKQAVCNLDYKWQVSALQNRNQELLKLLKRKESSIMIPDEDDIQMCMQWLEERDMYQVNHLRDDTFELYINLPDNITRISCIYSGDKRCEAIKTITIEYLMLARLVKYIKSQKAE